MSQRPISLSGDLKDLRAEGYNIEIRAGHLLVKDVPYVTEGRVVQRATLISTLNLAGDETQVPEVHTVWFTGSYPCRQDGTRLEMIISSEGRQDLGRGLIANYQFSQKPSPARPEYPLGYANYHEKMTTYVGLLLGHAQAIDPNVSPLTGQVVEATGEDSVFRYVDNASGRAGIGALMERLEQERVAIVGLGGSGSYVLDLLAKTPIKEIHLFDGDVFSQHNAFRAPGAPSFEELTAKPTKVAHFASLYGKMRHGIVPIEEYLDATNADLLHGMDFVFLCIDRNDAKRELVLKLQELGIAFIDVGMGVEQNPESGLYGILRVTTSTPAQRQHVWDKQRIPFSEVGPADEYASNIQIADLNALNATLAVIKWKKLRGFYADFEGEHFSAYTIDGNHLLNEDPV